MQSAPKTSICEFTTFHATFAEDVAAYKAAGAGGIGIDEFKLESDSLAQFRESGLKATYCVPSIAAILPNFLGGPRDPSERVEAISASIRRLAEFEPVAVMLMTGPGRELRPTVVEGLKRLSEVAGKVGVPLTLETAPNTLAQNLSLVNTLPEALELIDEAGVGEIVSVFFDAWMLWETPNVLADLETHIARIGGVHLSDDRGDGPPNVLDRIMPGEGLLPLPAMLRVLDDAGFGGWYEVEVLSDDGSVLGRVAGDPLWELPAEELARRAMVSFESVWARR